MLHVHRLIVADTRNSIALVAGHTRPSFIQSWCRPRNVPSSCARLSKCVRLDLRYHARQDADDARRRKQILEDYGLGAFTLLFYPQF